MQQFLPYIFYFFRILHI